MLGSTEFYIVMRGQSSWCVSFQLTAIIEVLSLVTLIVMAVQRTFVQTTFWFFK